MRTLAVVVAVLALLVAAGGAFGYWWFGVRDSGPAGWTQEQLDTAAINCQENDNTFTACKCFVDQLSLRWSIEKFRQIDLTTDYQLRKDSIDIGLICGIKH